MSSVWDDQYQVQSLSFDRSKSELPITHMLSSFSTKQSHAHARVFKTNPSKSARLSYRHHQAAVLTPHLPGLWSCRQYLTSQELRFFSCEAGMWSTHRTLRRLISRELVFKNKLIPISYFPMFFFFQKNLNCPNIPPTSFLQTIPFK